MKLQLMSILKSKVFMYVCISLLLVAGFMGGCSLMNQRLGLPDDNIIEETIEDVVEHKTGVELDLSPSSKEQ